MLVAVPFRQQASVVHLDRRTPILPQSAVCGFIPKCVAGEQGLIKVGLKFGTKLHFSCHTSVCKPLDVDLLKDLVWVSPVKVMNGVQPLKIVCVVLLCVGFHIGIFISVRT